MFGVRTENHKGKFRLESKPQSTGANQATYYFILERGAKITDIFLYEYSPDKNLRIKMFLSLTESKTFNIKSNKLNAINLNFVSGGVLRCIVLGSTIMNFVLFYEV